MAETFEIIPDVDYIGAHKSEVGIPASSKDAPYNGFYLAVTPTKPPCVETVGNQYCEINYTGPPGSCSNMYYKLVYWLPKYQYFIVKADEWIEVSPTHTEYYQRTLAQKKELEGVIKTGLASAASAVADYELVRHDMRRYMEILDYFKQKDEHLLRAMFIDQVDVHTGEGISLRSIVARWSTIILDFQKLSSEDVDPDKITKKLDVSKAESIILTTKNKLYNEWKKNFRGVVAGRYEHLKMLVESRKKSITEYQEWLKPYISRFRTLKTRHEIPSERGEFLRSWVEMTGQRTFTNEIRMFAWKTFKVAEQRKIPTVKTGKFVVDPYDDYIRENFVLNDKTGLARLYPWLTNLRSDGKKDEKYVYEADAVADEIKKDWLNRKFGLSPFDLYYNMFDFKITRLGVALSSGELEDITFYIRNCVLSQNVLLLRIMDLKCKERELERYIEEILGVRTEGAPVSEVVRKEYPELFGIKPKEPSEFEKFAEGWRNMSKEFGGFFNTMLSHMKVSPELKRYFIKEGNYERDFTERITKQYLITSGDIFGGVVNFIKKMMEME